MPYWDTLRLAMARTKAMGLVDGTVGAINPPIASGRLLAAAIEMNIRMSPARDNANLAGECASICLRTKSAFEHLIGAPVLLTLGSIVFEGVPLLSIPSADLDEIKRHANYHVWWTLGSGQVVDITLMVHLALLKEAEAESILPLIGSPDQIDQIKWIPFLIGERPIRQLLSE
jgi:hypothetical protein